MNTNKHLFFEEDGIGLRRDDERFGEPSKPATWKDFIPLSDVEWVKTPTLTTPLGTHFEPFVAQMNLWLGLASSGVSKIKISEENGIITINPGWGDYKAKLKTQEMGK